MFSYKCADTAPGAHQLDFPKNPGIFESAFKE